MSFEATEAAAPPWPYGKLIAGFWFENLEVMEQALNRFALETPGVQRRSPVQNFSFQTAETEAPSPVYRCFVSFSGLISLETLTRWKHHASFVEAHWKQEGKRRVNVNPGYLDLHKVVMLSAKDGGHKIYLGQNVWADLLMIKTKEGLHPFHWTPTDLRHPDCYDFFAQAQLDFKHDVQEASED